MLPTGQITVNQAIQPFMEALFPLPNGRELGGGVAQYLFTRPQPTNEYFTQGRIDHRFSGVDSLFGRYTLDNGNVDRPPTTKAPIANTKERSRNQYVTLEYQHVFSPRLLNTLRLGFNRSDHASVNERTLNIPPQLTWIPGQPMGYLTISGVATEDFGDYRLPRLDRLNNWQYADTVFLNRGAHGIKIGVESQRIQFNQNTTSQVGGLLTFTSLSNFLQGIPSQFDFAIPGGLDPERGYRQTLLAPFVQDDIRLRPPDRESRLALRVCQCAHGSKREDFEPTKCDRPRAECWRSMVCKSLAEELRSACGHRLGPLFERQNLDSRRVRHI